MILDKDLLRGHTAVVSGASSGIGLEFSRCLASLGMNVVMISNDGDNLRRQAKEIEKTFGTRTFPLDIDLTEYDSPTNVIGFVRSNSLSPLLLINNAGIFDFKGAADMSQRRVDMYIDLHMRAVTMLSILFAKEMMGQEYVRGLKFKGYILNMSSMSCWMPMPGISLYSATKAYIRVFSRALRLEVKPAGVSVTVACPGGIATDLFGLSPKLQKVGVQTGILATTRKFTQHALKRTISGKPQYINGIFNRITIFICGITPEKIRELVKSKILDKLENK